MQPHDHVVAGVTQGVIVAVEPPHFLGGLLDARSNLVKMQVFLADQPLLEQVVVNIILPGAPEFVEKVFYGERSSVGRAQDCGSCGRGFDPHRSPQFIIH